MYNYMRAMQSKFFKLPERPNDINELYAAVKGDMEKEKRKILLRLADEECAYCDMLALEAFVAGWCVAMGVKQETEENKYSFEDAEEAYSRIKALEENDE